MTNRIKLANAISSAIIRGQSTISLAKQSHIRHDGLSGVLQMARAWNCGCGAPDAGVQILGSIRRLSADIKRQAKGSALCQSQI